MKVACIHALPASVKPMELAFHNKENVEVFHLLDSYLLTLKEEHGTYNEAINTRFMNMFDMAIKAEVDVIQLTCSAFNSLVPKFRPLYPNIRTQTQVYQDV